MKETQIWEINTNLRNKYKFRKEIRKFKKKFMQNAI